MEKKTVVSFSIDKTLNELLTAEAKSKGCSKSKLAQSLIKQSLISEALFGESDSE
jgi:hypothetical protein